MQVRTANSIPLQNPVNPLMPDGNKISYKLKAAGLFLCMTF